MAKEKLIKNTLKTLYKLPDERIKEVNDFADYILKKYEEEIILKGAQELMSSSGSFDFLNDEEELYTIEDLKEKFK